jgi:hypothetical protein
VSVYADPEVLQLNMVQMGLVCVQRAGLYHLGICICTDVPPPSGYSGFDQYVAGGWVRGEVLLQGHCLWWAACPVVVVRLCAAV